MTGDRSRVSPPRSSNAANKAYAVACEIRRRGWLDGSYLKRRTVAYWLAAQGAYANQNSTTKKDCPARSRVISPALPQFKLFTAVNGLIGDWDFCGARRGRPSSPGAATSRPRGGAGRRPTARDAFSPRSSSKASAAPVYRESRGRRALPRSVGLRRPVRRGRFAREFVDFLITKKVLQRVRKSSSGPGWVVKVRSEGRAVISEFINHGRISPVLTPFFDRHLKK